MKFALALAALLVAATVAPAFAGYHCYHINGRTVCCNTFGNQTYCN